MKTQSILVQPGDRHVLTFFREALEQEQSLNYLRDDAVCLHLVLRAEPPMLVANDCRLGEWQDELRIPLPAEALARPLVVVVDFRRFGARISVDGGQPHYFERWSCGAEPLELRLPGGIDLKRVSQAEPAEALRQPAAPAEAGPLSQAWLAALPPGGRFADLSALPFPEAELLSAALRQGAAAVAIDGTGLSGGNWPLLQARLAAGGQLSAEALEAASFQSADLLDSYFAEQAGHYDLVACRGLLPHLPEPLAALRNLRRITALQCLIALPLLPERLATAAGALDLSATGQLCLPLASPQARAVVVAHFRALGADVAALLPEDAAGWMPAGDPELRRWWWLFTRPGLERLLPLAGFRILREAVAAGGLQQELVLEAVPQAPG